MRFVFVTSVLLLCTPVFAQLTPPIMPPACAETRDSSGYVNGYNSGMFLARQTWLKLSEDCAQVDKAVKTINNVVTIVGASVTSSNYGRCRLSGIVDGMAKYATAISNTCQMDCSQDGSMFGALYAQAYCELAISLQGLADPGDFLRPPTTSCGQMFQTSCDQSFFTTAPAYMTAGAVACQPYTVDPFTTAYVNTDEMVCTFEALPPTPAPGT